MLKVTHEIHQESNTEHENVFTITRYIAVS